MQDGARCLFLPGWGAPPALYAAGLPRGWRVLEPPPFSESGGSLAYYRHWIVEALRAEPEPVILAGHSMGGALAIHAAATAPERVAGLVLVSPAGLPLTKPIPASLGSFFLQLGAGRYPLRETMREVRRILTAPRRALQVALAVRALDLSAEMERVRRSAIPATVIGSASDTLVTRRHCLAAAKALGARYRELALPGGHMWMLGASARLESELAASVA
jgi:pimeloyl-ACP methyl ester carboxylesterase